MLHELYPPETLQGCSPNLIGDKFILSNRDYERDSGSGAALICDPRNDEHRILSQLTVAWMTRHNKFIDDNPTWDFDAAKEATIKEYQAVVLGEMLPYLLDPTVSSVVRMMYSLETRGD